MSRKIADEDWICKRCGGNERNNRRNCKHCIAITTAKLYAENIEKIKAQHAKYYVDYYVENKEKIKAKNARRHTKKRQLRDQTLLNLTFLQLADEIGKMTNE